MLEAKLTPKTDAEKQLVSLLESGQVRPEFLRAIADRIKSTHGAVVNAAPEAAVKPADKIKEEPLTPVPFTELAALLAPKGINLQQLSDDHVAMMVRRGIIKETEADQYRAKFQTISVRKSKLENIPQGYRPMLFVDDMTLVQAAERFIQTQDIGFCEDAKLADFKKVDPKTRKPLKNQTPSGLARFSFTPDAANLTSDLTGKTADSCLKQMQKGVRYMEPAQWFQMFIEGFEKAMKELNLSNGKDWKNMTKEEKQAIMQDKRIDSYLPDAKTFTQFPDYRNQFGDVLTLHFSPDAREVEVDSWYPDFTSGNVGVRPSLG